MKTNFLSEEEMSVKRFSVQDIMKQIFPSIANDTALSEKKPVGNVFISDAERLELQSELIVKALIENSFSALNEQERLLDGSKTDKKKNELINKTICRVGAAVTRPLPPRTRT